MVIQKPLCSPQESGLNQYTVHSFKGLRIIALSLCIIYLPLSIYGQVNPYEVLITELMIDPNPVVGLPNFEWVELYNRSDETINLEDFRYSSGVTRYKLPAYDLAPGGYVMLCDDSDFDELSTFGSTIEIRTFPTLTNGGDAATLEDPSGNLIHEVVYEKSWYGDTSKDDGGYTLEMINPNDPCLGASNWAASASPSGATPAAENSNWAPSNPSDGIIALTVVSTSAAEIAIRFDRVPSSGLSEMVFDLSPSVPVVDIMPSDEDDRTILLTLGSDLIPGTVYTVTIDGSAADCLGGSSGSSQTLDFLLPEPFGLGDLIINEILFNPIGRESDYVELYNNSSKFIDISQLLVGNFKPDGSGSDRAIETVYVIEPEDYLVLTEDKAALLARYPSAIGDKVIEVDLPSFNNTDGNVTIFLEEDNEIVVIDEINYSEDMHNAFVDDEEGVALERVDPNISASVNSNWKSGAASKGYGTPTLPNSQADLDVDQEAGFVYLQNKTFYPENQIDEQLNIIFEIDRSDYIGSVEVFDGSGRYVHQLANNQLIGRNDLYTWDGRSEDGRLMNAGVYIVVVRLFTAEGDLLMKKLPCVLSRKI